MSVEVVNSFGNLEEELEKAKSNLKGLNDNIRRIIGRDPEDRVDRKRPAGSFDSSGRRPDRQRYVPSDVVSAPQAKRRQVDNLSSTTKSVFSRLSGPPNREEDYTKPKLHSRVIKEQPTKQDIVAAQGADAQSRARNRRMFGSLMGTLQKFCQEESRLKPIEEKKAQIEKKLEEQAIQERENMKKEKECLFSDRKRKQMEIKAIELKMLKMKELTSWVNSVQPLGNFIRTKAKPHLYYLPKVMNKKAEEKLQSSKEGVEKMIEKKRVDVAEEISNIELRFTNDDEDKPISIKNNGANETEEMEDDNDNENENNNHTPDDNSDIENFNQNRKLVSTEIVKVKIEKSVEEPAIVKKEKLADVASDDEKKVEKENENSVGKDSRVEEINSNKDDNEEDNSRDSTDQQDD